MAFPGLPETSKMQTFTPILHHSRTNNVNVYVAKVYPSGLIFEKGYIRGAYIQGVNWVTYLEGFIRWWGARGGVIYGRRMNGILRYYSKFIHDQHLSFFIRLLIAMRWVEFFQGLYNQGLDFQGLGLGLHPVGK